MIGKWNKKACFSNNSTRNQQPSQYSPENQQFAPENQYWLLQKWDPYVMAYESNTPET